MLSGDDNSTLRGDDNKPARKSGQRKAKTEQGKKAEPRKRKSAQRQDPLPDQLLEAAEAIAAEVTPTETASIDTSATEGAPVAQVASVQGQNPLLDEVLEAAEAMTTETAEAITVDVTSTGYAPVDASPTIDTALVPVASGQADVVNCDVVDYQTIANAYGNYARESLDQTRSFFEKLSGVRSLDKAFALQTEFARQAYDGFVAESQKIRELHGQLARQRLQRWEGLVARMIKPL
jgi:Phasin protein